jgi:hypothetical protein
MSFLSINTKNKEEVYKSAYLFFFFAFFFAGIGFAPQLPHEHSSFFLNQSNKPIFTSFGYYLIVIYKVKDYLSLATRQE